MQPAIGTVKARTVSTDLTNPAVCLIRQKLNECWANVERSTQTAAKEIIVESPLNESLNQFKLDSARFQQAFNIFTLSLNVERPVQTPLTFGSTKC